MTGGAGQNAIGVVNELVATVDIDGVLACGATGVVPVSGAMRLVKRSTNAMTFIDTTDAPLTLSRGGGGGGGASGGNIMLTSVALQASAYEEITVSTTAVGLTVANLQLAEKAMIQVKTNPVNVRFDGGTPTSSVGVNYTAAQTFILSGPREMAQFLAIRSGAADATLAVTYLGSR